MISDLVGAFAAAGALAFAITYPPCEMCGGTGAKNRITTKMCHNSFFCLMSPEEIPALAAIIKEIVTKMKVIFKDPAYNFIVHSSPLSSETSIDSYHWHIEFIPKLTRVAGFEWGTGFYVVPTPPELAAQFLREAKEPLTHQQTVITA